MASSFEPPVGDLRSAQKAFAKSLQTSGMLPCEKRGIGLILLVVSVASLIGAVALFALGGPKILALLLVLDAAVANIMNGLHSKRWLQAQPGWPT